VAVFLACTLAPATSTPAGADVEPVIAPVFWPNATPANKEKQNGSASERIDAASITQVGQARRRPAYNTLYGLRDYTKNATHTEPSGTS
jgi:hypothetical protein